MTDNYFHTHKNQTMKLLTQYVIIPVSTIITSNLNVDIAARRGDYFFFYILTSVKIHTAGLFWETNSIFISTTK